MKKILVVVDMQKDFITGALGNDECRATVENVVRLIEDPDYSMIFSTKDTHTSDYMNTQEGRKLPVIHCVKGTEGWEYDDRIKAALDMAGSRHRKCFEKKTFGSSEFFTWLTENEGLNTGETEIDFCGVCTGICVISNAMLAKAALPEATVKVIENACACVTPESHKNAIEAMKLCQIEIV